MNYSYVNENGKTIRGAAAMNHLVYSIFGGYDNFGEAIGRVAVKKHIDSNKTFIQSFIDTTRNVSKLITVRK